MEYKLSLDRGAIVEIIYPIGVSEQIKYTFNDEVSLTDTYEIVLSLSFNSREVFKKIIEGAELIRFENTLTWKINYGYDEIKERKYFYEIRNVSQDWIEIKGEFIATKTIK